MKKLLSLTLAAAMVMSMASVAFAATKSAKLKISDKPYAVDTNDVGEEILATGKIGYGDSVGYPIYLITADKDEPAVATFAKDSANWTDYEMAKKLKVKATWESTPDLVKGVSIGKKKVVDSFAYFVVVETNDAVTTAKQDVIGSVKLSGSGITFGAGKTSAKEAVLPVAFSLGYNVEKGADSSVTLTGTGKSIFTFGSDSAKNLPEDEEFEIVLYGDAGRFVVNTFGQGKVLVGNSVKYNEGFEAKIPDANYVYVNGNGAMFNKIGTLYLKGASTDVPYQVVNDKLVKMNATYDDVEEAFVVRTRAIGKYVIAEKELDLEVANAADPVEGEVPEVVAPGNPTTGAAC